jgi:glycine oxidase
MEYVGFDASVTDEGLAQIHRSMVQIYPALDGVHFQRTWAGLRPMTPDGRPLVGADPTVSGLWYATGHGRNGILLAGYTGEVIAQLVTGQPIEHDLAAVDPGRFWAY